MTRGSRRSTCSKETARRGNKMFEAMKRQQDEVPGSGRNAGVN